MYDEADNIVIKMISYKKERQRQKEFREHLVFNCSAYFAIKINGIEITTLAQPRIHFLRKCTRFSLTLSLFLLSMLPVHLVPCRESREASNRGLSKKKRDSERVCETNKCRERGRESRGANRGGKVTTGFRFYLLQIASSYPATGR